MRCRSGYSFLVSFFIVLLFFQTNAHAAFSKSVNEILGEIPVQDGGRIKPFESFARESVLYITGKTSFQRIPPTVLVWFWIASGEEWANQPMLYISHPDLRKRFSSDLVENRITPNLVLNDLDFAKAVGAAQRKNDAKEKLTSSEQKTLELYSRARSFDAIRSGFFPGFIPHPDQPMMKWVPLEGILSEEGAAVLKGFFPEEAVNSLKNSGSYFLSRMKQGNLALAVSSAEAFRSDLQGLLESRGILLDDFKIHAELFYWHVRPFQLAWIFYLVSVALWFGIRFRSAYTPYALAAFFAGFLLHTFGFVLRVVAAGRPPVSNMYESIIWVAWGAVLFSLILWKQKGQIGAL